MRAMGLPGPWGRRAGGWQQELLWGEAGAKEKSQSCSQQEVCGEGSASRSIFCHTWGVRRGAPGGRPTGAISPRPKLLDVQACVAGAGEQTG